MSLQIRAELKYLEVAVKELKALMNNLLLNQGKITSDALLQQKREDYISLLNGQIPVHAQRPELSKQPKIVGELEKLIRAQGHVALPAPPVVTQVNPAGNIVAVPQANPALQAPAVVPALVRL